MKKRAAFGLSFLFLFAMAGASSDLFAAAGELDTGFSADGATPGVALFDAVFGKEEGRAVAVQNDGKVVVAGGFFDTVFNVDRLIVTRFNADGTVDENFSGDGAFNGTGEVANAVAVQPDGKIVVAGRAGTNLLITRLKENGFPDPDFGSGIDGTGRLTIDAGGTDDEIFAIALREDGEIIAAGQAKGDLMIAGFTKTGFLDKAFFGKKGTSTAAGLLLTDFGGTDSARAIALETDGRVVVAGHGDDGCVVARFLRDGSALDDSFSVDGFDKTDFSLLEVTGNGVAIQPDGKVVVAGSGEGGIALARYQTDGSFDGTFGILDTPGRTALHPAEILSGGTVALQGDGKVIVGGTSDDQLLLLRFCPDGSPDDGVQCGGDGFGVDGLVTTPGPNAEGLSLTLAPDGKIVVGGREGADVLAARYLNDPGAVPPDAGGASGGSAGDTDGGGDAGEAVGAAGNSGATDAENGSNGMEAATGGCSLVRGM